ncbi:hypothetical protein [Hymenobacter metallicola]|uniref:Uncharacterized protein n=1 Tax=Hymenobacter metallicola TaxID=2563114 RepID=A0A4Z0QDR5_9BACT|nr:hypothetical protein [Hymenobacter metallicola]TGE27313.1 hypothetical protein E5K02_13060 [Hymenobacter metallicola]
MANDYEQSRSNMEKLDALCSASDHERNEDTTRIQMIDALLLECLGWSRENLITEESYQGKYADYILTIHRPVAILEAKREGDYFTLPIGITNNNIYSLKTLCKDNKNLKDALEQVSGYCQKRGVEVGIVCNGWQLVIFVANRIDGVPPLEGNAIVFASTQVMLNNFQLLWNVLSKPGLESRYVINTLVGNQVQSLPAKLSSTINNYPGVKNRNPFQMDMQIISDLVLEDVIREKEVESRFLKACYCKSGPLSQFAMVSKEILTTRYKYIFEKEEQAGYVEPVVTKNGISKDLSDIVANSLSRRPVLLLGDVGVGKTSFINNLIKVEAKAVFDNALTFKINLGAQAVLTTLIEKVVIDEVATQLKEDYNINIDENLFVREVYKDELASFKNGIYKPLYDIGSPDIIMKEIEFLAGKVMDRPQHVRKSLEQATKIKKKQAIIFLDNCDQRGDDAQQQAFLISQELAEHWPVTVFVTLRPETFHRSVKVGALSGYHPKAFSIAPPRLDEVINRRLNFAQLITRGEIPLSSLKINTTFSKLDTLIQILKDSFARNPRLFEFIDNISAGNIRQAIDVVKSFFGSGHVNTEKILHIFSTDGDYDIPFHEFLRAVIFGDNIYYDPSRSLITNVFDIHYNDTKEYFLGSIVLGMLQSSMNSGRGDGYLESEKIYAQLQGYGYTVPQIDFLIGYYVSRKLIESTSRNSVGRMSASQVVIRITTIGAYHFTTLIKLFTYVDAMIVDIPFISQRYRAQIGDAKHIAQRLDRAELFVEYMDGLWEPIKHLNTYFDWSRVSYDLRRDIDIARRKFNRSIKS